MDYSKLAPQELIRECVSNPCAEAWDAFIAEFSPVIVANVRATARCFRERSPEIHKELVQDVFLKICANKSQVLRNMDTSPDSNPHAYFKKMAIHLTIDHFKSRNASKRGSGVTPENLDDVQPASPARSAGGLGAIEWNILLREMDATLTASGFSERERNIFWLYWLQEWTAKEIAALPWAGLSEKGVESLLRRMRLALRSFFDQDKGTAA